LYKPELLLTPVDQLDVLLLLQEPHVPSLLPPPVLHTSLSRVVVKDVLLRNCKSYEVMGAQSPDEVSESLQKKLKFSVSSLNRQVGAVGWAGLSAATNLTKLEAGDAHFLL